MTDIKVYSRVSLQDKKVIKYLVEEGYFKSEAELVRIAVKKELEKYSTSIPTAPPTIRSHRTPMATRENIIELFMKTKKKVMTTGEIADHLGIERTQTVFERLRRMAIDKEIVKMGMLKYKNNLNTAWKIYYSNIKDTKYNWRLAEIFAGMPDPILEYKPLHWKENGVVTKND